MDYATMRGLFFAPPAVERPTPPAAARRSPARRLRDAIEPLACQAIWSSATAEQYSALGLDDFFAAYAWQRTAVLGTPPTALAVTALGVFAPGLIGPPYETGSAALAGADVTRIRREAPGATVRAVLGDVGAEAARAVAVLRRGLDAADCDGATAVHRARRRAVARRRFAALVHACNLLREHRGDSHLAACAVAGLDPVQMNVLTELYCGYRLGEYTPTRGWSAEQIDDTVAGLRARGLIDGELLSAAGLAFRDGVEEQTDAMQQSIVDAAGPDLDSVTKQLRHLVRHPDRGRRGAVGPRQAGGRLSPPSAPADVSAVLGPSPRRRTAPGCPRCRGGEAEPHHDQALGRHHDVHCPSCPLAK